MNTIHYLTQVSFDHGAVATLPQECMRVGISRALVVTDAGVRDAGVLGQALTALKDVPHVVFDGTPSNRLLGVPSNTTCGTSFSAVKAWPSTPASRTPASVTTKARLIPTRMHSWGRVATAP